MSYWSAELNLSPETLPRASSWVYEYYYIVGMEDIFALLWERTIQYSSIISLN